MKYYELGKSLEELTEPDLNLPGVCIITPEEAPQILQSLGVLHAEDHDLDRISLCKAEVHRKYMEANLCIPDLKDPRNKTRIQFYITKSQLVFLDISSLTDTIISRIRKTLTDQGQTKERFLYDYFRELLNGDMIELDHLEEKIMALEEAVLSDSAVDFQETHAEMRKKLVLLRAYYGGLTDMIGEFEDNDNNLFEEELLPYFDILSARSLRLVNKTERLLEYLSEIRETNLEIITDKQNHNMVYLTIVSTIFLPLTLITSWFGMNFEHMPGLKYGYYPTIGVCVLVVLIIIWIFKKKKMM